ncbi:MAG: helix-turn-helix domain-containing protein [Halocynthiibacter sp.]
MNDTVSPVDTTTPDGRSFGVTTFPQVYKSERWRMDELHSHEDHTIMWVTRGQGRVVIRGTTYGFGPNNVFFIPAGTLFSIEVSSFVFGSILRIPTSASDQFPQKPEHIRMRDAFFQADFTTLHDRMHHEITHPDRGSLRANAAILELMLVWLERIKDPAAVIKKSAAEKLMLAFTDLIEDQLYDGLSVADYAGQLNVTPTHLTRVCQKSCDRSASHILTERVMYEAKTLLRDTDMAVNKIAVELTFTSAAYFTRAFQNSTQQTPTEFRNNSTTQNAYFS